MRILFRLFSLIVLAAAVIIGVLDALHSVTSGKIELAQLEASWQNFHANSLIVVEDFLQNFVHPYIWDPITKWVLLQPTVAVLLVISFLFYAIAYKRVRPEDRFLAK